jgi:hypothetical protein
MRFFIHTLADSTAAASDKLIRECVGVAASDYTATELSQPSGEFRQISTPVW